MGKRQDRLPSNASKRPRGGDPAWIVPRGDDPQFDEWIIEIHLHAAERGNVDAARWLLETACNAMSVEGRVAYLDATVREWLLGFLRRCIDEPDAVVKQVLAPHKGRRPSGSPLSKHMIQNRIYYLVEQAISTSNDNDGPENACAAVTAQLEREHMINPNTNEVITLDVVRKLYYDARREITAARRRAR